MTDLFEWSSVGDHENLLAALKDKGDSGVGSPHRSKPFNNWMWLYIGLRL